MKQGSRHQFKARLSYSVNLCLKKAENRESNTKGIETGKEASGKGERRDWKEEEGGEDEKGRHQNFHRKASPQVSGKVQVLL